MMPLLSWAQNNQLLAVVAALAGVFVLRELVLRKLTTPFYYIILFPGVIVHELSHLLGCLVTLTPIKQVKFFSEKGGFVIHEKPPIKFIGEFIISVAPLVVGLFLVHNLASQIYLKSGLQLKPSSIIYLYFMLSIILTMMPSWKDVQNSLPGYVALIALSFLFYDKIAVAYFENIFSLLLALVVILLVFYTLLTILSQKKIFRLK